MCEQYFMSHFFFIYIFHSVWDGKNMKTKNL